MAEVLVYLRAYAQGEEAWYMSNGDYMDYVEDLAITMPLPQGAASNLDKSYFFVPQKGIWMDVIGTVGVPSTYYVQGGLGHIPPGQRQLFGYCQRFDVYRVPGQFYTTGQNFLLGACG